MEEIGKIVEILANEKQIAESRLERLEEDSDPLPYRTVKNRKRVEYQEKRIYLLEKVVEWLNEKRETQRDIDPRKVVNKTQELENTLKKVKFDKKLERLEDDVMENWTIRQGVLSSL